MACEFSGRVRDAFIAEGHDAMSCDLLPTEVPGPHHQGDVTDLLDDGFDLMVAHPPCTLLAASGARWWAGRRAEQAESLDFVRTLFAAPIPHIAIENPVSLIGTLMRKPTQTIQPWQFGHPEQKATCLWLVNLPPLTPTEVVPGRQQRIANLPQSDDRARERSRTFTGIAQAMARQWGAHDRQQVLW